MTDRFRVFPQFDQPEYARYASSRSRLEQLILPAFPGDRLQDKLVRGLIERRAINLKEVLESFEFHHRVRRRVRRPVMADLFCGHGLTGLLFAASERSVERVVLVDKRRPPSFDVILHVVCSLAPWVRDKVEYREVLVEEAELDPGTALLAVHACGERTDVAIELAERLGGPVALMPCCYRSAPRTGPRGLIDALGATVAIDVQRTYRLEGAGLQVDWTEVPRAITPMNRVIVGWRG